MGHNLIKETPSSTVTSNSFVVKEPASVPVCAIAPVPVPVPSGSGSNLQSPNNAIIEVGDDWSADVSDELLVQSAMTMDMSARRNTSTFAPVFTNCTNITINFGHSS